MTTKKDKSLLDKAKDLAEDIAETASDLGEHPVVLRADDGAGALAAFR